MRLNSFITDMAQSSVFRKLISIFFCVIVLIPCFIPFTASAVDTDVVIQEFIMPHQKPQLNDNNGYILLLCYDNTSREYFVRMLNWSYYYHCNNNPQGEDDGYDFAFDSRVDVYVDNTSVIISPIKTSSFNYASFSVSYASSTGFYDLLHYDYYANGANLESYEYVMESNITVCGYQVNGNCEVIHDNDLTSKLNFACLWADQVTEYNTFLELLDVAYQVSQYDKSILEQLTILNTHTNNIKGNVAGIVNLLGTWLTRIDAELDVHTGLLKEIRDLLNTSGEETLEYVDNSSVNNHNATGEALLNNSNASSAQSDLKVSLNTTASSSIWGMVTNFVSLNANVFGFFITLLSLGVVALILNR